MDGPNVFESLIDYIRAEADDDWVWISSLVEAIRYGPGHDVIPPELRRPVLDALLVHMVTSGEFVPGDCHPVIRGKLGSDAEVPPRSEWFRVWEGGPIDWLTRIYSELDAWDLDEVRSFDVATFIPTFTQDATS